MDSFSFCRVTTCLSLKLHILILYPWFPGILWNHLRCLHLRHTTDPYCQSDISGYPWALHTVTVLQLSAHRKDQWGDVAIVKQQYMLFSSNNLIYSVSISTGHQAITEKMLRKNRVKNPSHVFCFTIVMWYMLIMKCK